MPLLDIEKAIRSDEVGSRFRLVNIAGQRARELNSPKEDTLARQSNEHTKFTTTALEEIIEKKIKFTDERESK
jgi:DNA-directed RNA polymerase subunit omega